MNTEESVAWFRAKNARRKRERETMPAKKLHELRKYRRSLINGAHGKKETNNGAVPSIDVD